jgi:hypothetical protein
MSTGFKIYVLGHGLMSLIDLVGAAYLFGAGGELIRGPGSLLAGAVIGISWAAVVWYAESKGGRR